MIFCASITENQIIFCVFQRRSRSLLARTSFRKPAISLIMKVMIFPRDIVFSLGKYKQSYPFRQYDFIFRAFKQMTLKAYSGSNVSLPPCGRDLDTHEDL